jgi:hypothetical protein
MPSTSRNTSRVELPVIGCACAGEGREHILFCVCNEDWPRCADSDCACNQPRLGRKHSRRRGNVVDILVWRARQLKVVNAEN